MVAGFLLDLSFGVFSLSNGILNRPQDINNIYVCSIQYTKYLHFSFVKLTVFLILRILTIGLIIGVKD